ncbi:MAG: 30S ribosomal protein S8e [Candidatus Micrarchaeia archaeon]|jgi:small subunit ribosomal protein S8e
MVQYHAKRLSKTSGSGGKLKTSADKKRAHIGGFFAHTKVIRPEDIKGTKEAVEVRKTFRSKGGKKKLALDYALYASVTGLDGKTKKMRIINVVDNKANRMYSRENVITCGSIIQVEGGKAKVTSRPGQNGMANAVMLKQ